MTIWSDDLTRDNATTETRDTIFGVPPLIAWLTLAIPVMPLIKDKRRSSYYHNIKQELYPDTCKSVRARDHPPKFSKIPQISLNFSD